MLLRLKSLRVCGILVLVLALWVGCGDDKNEGTKKEEKKVTPKKTTPKKTTPVERTPKRTYLWTPLAAEDGDWGGASRETMDSYCSKAVGSAADNAVVGRPITITDANADYITKALALGHDINNFAELGAAAVKAGAHKDSLNDGVYSLSFNGLSEVKIANNYLKFYTEEWRTSLEDGLLAKDDDDLFWIGATEGGGANAGTRDSANNFFNCNNFKSNRDGTTPDLDEGTVILGESISTDHDNDGLTDDVSPLRLRTAEYESRIVNCNATAQVLCISFSKK